MQAHTESYMSEKELQKWKGFSYRLKLDFLQKLHADGFYKVFKLTPDPLPPPLSYPPLICLIPPSKLHSKFNKTQKQMDLNKKHEILVRNTAHYQH